DQTTEGFDLRQDDTLLSSLASLIPGNGKPPEGIHGIAGEHMGMARPDPISHQSANADIRPHQHLAPTHRENHLALHLPALDGAPGLAITHVLIYPPAMGNILLFPP